jgi:phage host-nuclease inhibitor protein Gam
LARLKPNVKKIESLEDANLTLKEIGLLESELESIDGGTRKQIAEIRTAAVKAGEPVRKRITDLSALLGAYAEYSRADLFKDRKSVLVSFGIFGCRKSTSVSVKKTTLALLKKLGLGHCIRTKEEADKDEISKDLLKEQV